MIELSTEPHLLVQSLATLETVDHRQVNWADVRSTAYLIHQHFRYEYSGPIRHLKQRLVIIPPERHGDQRLVAHHLEVSSPASERHTTTDAFGNHVVSIGVDDIESSIDFTAWILVEREAATESNRVTSEVYRWPAYREFSWLTHPDDALRRAAASLQAYASSPAELAANINAWVHREMRYAHNVTGVRTSASEAFAHRQGVCQDYSHVMLAICRSCGLPARYVSGHLLGEGGTHAWVEVLLPDPDQPGRFYARAFDPTNGNEPGFNYVTIAVGRDYGDVAPTSGTYVATSTGHLSTKKRAHLTAVNHLPAAL